LFLPKNQFGNGLHSYNEAFEKEYHTMASPRTRNIRSVSVRHKGLNQKVERLNSVKMKKSYYLNPNIL
jgi:hypothetical protein